jgi:hypothetical protein
MTLEKLIRKGGLRQLMAGSVAEVATVAVANPGMADTDSIGEWWVERAAIMEFDGGLSSTEAEEAAKERTALRYSMH